jgi:hypothetical protein
MEGKQLEGGSKESTHQQPSPPSQLASHQSLQQQQFLKGDIEEKHSEEEGQDAIQQLQAEAAGMPDLALNLKAMILSEQGLSSVQVDQISKEEELDFSFCLLMKIACTGGTPRNITRQVLQQSMTNAWRNKYYAISQVSSTVFLAHFRTYDDMMSVYTSQPWAVGSDILLFEWFDLYDDVNSSEDYKFDYIFVTIRAYGIPRLCRSFRLLTDILNQVGTASEYHILQDNMLHARQDYIWGVAKLKVNAPVKDKIKVIYPDKSAGITFLHYERIKRICMFCGIMFHTVQQCPIRTSMLKERSRKGLFVHDFPAQRLGEWIIDESLIPAEALQRTAFTTTGSQATVNPVLAKLQKLFAEDPKGKGKQIEGNPSLYHTSHQRQSAMEHDPLISPQHYAAYAPPPVPTIFPQTRMPPKRPMPSSELIHPHQTKKSTNLPQQEIQRETRAHEIISQTTESSLNASISPHQVVNPGVHIKENIGNSADDMDMDQGALAPALKVPRAP